VKSMADFKLAKTFRFRTTSSATRVLGLMVLPGQQFAGLYLIR
jgi:hypothetical protein